MPKVNFTLNNGETCAVTFEAGQSLVQVAQGNGIPGIEASCGGYCSCATCHVYVGEDWVEKISPISHDENELLEGTASDRLPTSRLSCQIKLTEALDGITVTIPERQS